MIDRERDRELHSRLLAGDPVAPAETAEAFLDPLIRLLHQRHPRSRDTVEIRDAVHDALIGYLTKPQQYDPSKRSLLGYLLMSAEGDLRNARAKRKRRAEHEITYDDVELQVADGKYQAKQGSHRRAEPDMALANLPNLARLFDDPRDRKALALMADGERSTESFARIWGVSSLSAEEQRREVKRRKDRIKKVLQRHGKSRDVR